MHSFEKNNANPAFRVGRSSFKGPLFISDLDNKSNMKSLENLSILRLFSKLFLITDYNKSYTNKVSCQNRLPELAKKIKDKKS